MFAAAVGMLAPPGKYKGFVSLVMGLILVSVMVAPLARFSTEIPATEWFWGFIQGDAPPGFDSGGGQHSYEHWRNTYLRYAFEEQLAIQLENMLVSNGFTVYATGFTFTSDLSGLTGVTATVSRTETPQRTPFISIRPVQVGLADQPEDCPTATAAKNLISQFYNLPLQHINVVVR